MSGSRGSADQEHAEANEAERLNSEETGVLTSPQRRRRSTVCTLQKNQKHYGKFVTIKS